MVEIWVTFFSKGDGGVVVVRQKQNARKEAGKSTKTDRV